MDKKPKIIVVGGGISGCMASLAAASSGAHVSLFTLLPPFRSPSSAICEGINAALDTASENDSPLLHANDTTNKGGGLSDPDAVKRMCDEAPNIVRFFDRMGVLFERAPDGLIALAKSEGFAKRRTARAGDSTARQVLSVLDGQIRGLERDDKLKLFEGWEFLSPVVSEKGICLGITAQRIKNSEIIAIASDAVIICSGNMKRFATPAFVHGAPISNPDLETGGLFVDRHHATPIRGLFAAGGAASQYHGAGVLPGNEILARAFGGMTAGLNAVASSLSTATSGGVQQSLLAAAKAAEEDALARAYAATGEENARVISRELDRIFTDGSADRMEKIIRLKERFLRAAPLDTARWENTEVPFMRRLMHKIALFEACAIAKAERDRKGAPTSITIKWTNEKPELMT